MNIVQIVGNKVWGGGERYVLDLCRALEADGHSVAVITRGKEAVDSRFRAAGFTPGRLPLGGLFDFISPGRLAAVLDRMDAPVVVHVHNFKMARLAVAARKMMKKPAKVRIVVTRHLVRPAKTDKSSIALYRAVDAIVFVSELALGVFRSTLPQGSVDETVLNVVHNAVVPPTAIEPAGKDSGEIRLVYTGRICAEKGLDVLVKALSRLENINGLRLHVAGTGTPADVERLMRLAVSLGIADRIEWHGHVDNVWPLIASADIAVLPSVVAEAFSMSILEYLAVGVPVVTTDRGSQPEIIENGVNGLLVAPGDDKALADALRRLASDSAMRASMAAAAKRTAEERVSYDVFYGKILNIYKG